MIEEYCRDIYNVGRKTDCSLSKINCLCPDKSSYEYLCYQCHAAQNDISSEEYQPKIDADSGEICIQHDFQYEISCTSPDWVDYQIINIGVSNICDEMKKNKVCSERLQQAIVELVALALACAAVSEDRGISYISMIDAFKPEQCMNHLWNLSNVIMQRIHSGKNCEKSLKKLCQCMEHLNMIYEQRERIGNEFRNYLENVCLGLESIGHGIELEQSFLWQAYNLINNKKTSESIEQFVFCGADTDGETVEIWRDAFKDLCFVLKEFLINYQEQKHIMKVEDYDKLIGMLNMFASEKVDIHTIKGLEQLNLQSTIAWTANADLVIRYLKNVARDELLKTFGLVCD